MLRHGLFVAALGCVVFPSISSAATSSLVAWANRATVDSDGDSNPDLSDFAPGVSDNGADSDADGIGDVIDPTPMTSNPALGDPGLGLYDPPAINAGSNLDLGYTMNLATPPGAWGFIDLDLGMDGIYDATYFGPMSMSTIYTISIPASLYTSASWNLNLAGPYALQAKAYAPGMYSQYESIVTSVVVLPEPSIVGCCMAGFALLASRRRR